MDCGISKHTLTSLPNREGRGNTIAQNFVHINKNQDEAVCTARRLKYIQGIFLDP